MDDFETAAPVVLAFQDPTSIRRSRALRIEQRFECQLYAHAIQDGYEVPCYILDISASGAQLRFDSLSTRSLHTKALAIDIPEIGRYAATFRWRSGAKAGVMFSISENHKATLKARLLDMFDPEYLGAGSTLTG